MRTEKEAWIINALPLGMGRGRAQRLREEQEWNYGIWLEDKTTPNPKNSYLEGCLAGTLTVQVEPVLFTKVRDAFLVEFGLGIFEPLTVLFTFTTATVLSQTSLSTLILEA